MGIGKRLEATVSKVSVRKRPAMAENELQRGSEPKNL